MSWRIGVSVTVLLYWTARVLATDISSAEAEGIAEYVPPSPLSRWYLRGDVSYFVNRPVYDFTLAGQETDTNRFGFAVGMGYRFGDMLRADLTMNYVGSDRHIDGSASVTNHKMWAGLVTGYLDLGTYAGWTPYAGVGLGVLRTVDSMNDRFPRADAEMDFAQDEFAYSLNAGVGYRMSERLTLDLGYQFLASPKTEYFDVDRLALDEGVAHHQIKVGLRYDLP